jgi:hypothetical protein
MSSSLADRVAALLLSAPPPAADAADALTRSVHEALGAVASLELGSRVLAQALRRAGHSRLPATRNELVEFIEAPLGQSISEVLGADVAAAVIAELRTIASRALPAATTSGLRPVNRTRSAPPAARTTQVAVPKPRLSQ